MRDFGLYRQNILYKKEKDQFEKVLPFRFKTLTRPVWGRRRKKLWRMSSYSILKKKRGFTPSLRWVRGLISCLFIGRTSYSRENHQHKDRYTIKNFISENTIFQRKQLDNRWLPFTWNWALTIKTPKSQVAPYSGITELWNIVFPTSPFVSFEWGMGRFYLLTEEMPRTFIVFQRVYRTINFCVQRGFTKTDFQGGKKNLKKFFPPEGGNTVF